jgi:hypothetical protein
MVRLPTPRPREALQNAPIVIASPAGARQSRVSPFHWCFWIATAAEPVLGRASGPTRGRPRDDGWFPKGQGLKLLSLKGEGPIPSGGAGRRAYTKATA